MLLLLTLVAAFQVFDAFDALLNEGLNVLVLPFLDLCLVEKQVITEVVERLSFGQRRQDQNRALLSNRHRGQEATGLVELLRVLPEVVPLQLVYLRGLYMLKLGLSGLLGACLEPILLTGPSIGLEHCLPVGLLHVTQI